MATGSRTVVGKLVAQEFIARSRPSVTPVATAASRAANGVERWSIVDPAPCKVADLVKIGDSRGGVHRPSGTD
jgi:hypothetical protein